ncbi:bifunctional hydroxymethylpyrimidine kinase/phosphomethylpyrimidine kinase [bacterium]|nr:bifunctional hydroxymethylpyrimidine kinase/phosphomethylpyrimidine kinase [bacterium]
MSPVLCIGGLDPCGYSGLTVDLKTCLAHGTRPALMTVAVTAQNSTNFLSIHTVPARTILRQLEAIRQEFRIRAIKTGLLANPSIVRLIADYLKDKQIILVVDPVLKSTTGRSFFNRELVEAYRQQLMPLASLVTPNLFEAELLSELRPLETGADLEKAARKLLTTGARAVLLKGGHRSGPPVDVLWDGSSFREFVAERQPGGPWRGLGCTLSSAITCQLASGANYDQAISRAKKYVSQVLAASIEHGTAPGLDHSSPSAQD